ncbi:MAG: hypothetical protein ACK5Q5_02505 [Planctomycetaceae bacterium]
MNRAILEACAPWCAALAVLCGLFVVVAWLSGGRWRPARLTALHHCESGAVQSLAFVLTLPLLVTILLFIVQVSQLMIALVTVNYAAFATARAASVWGPTMIDDQYGTLGGDDDQDDQNELPPGIAPGYPLLLNAQTVQGFDTRKYEKIFSAAAIACASVSPSRVTDDAYTGIGAADRAATVMRTLYPLFDTASAQNSRIPTRLNAKLGYSFVNTAVDLYFEDRNSQPVDGTRTYNPISHPTVEYFPSEVGWQDPITVTVYYDMLLLPGVGRMFSFIFRNREVEQGQKMPRFEREVDASRHNYRILLHASATMTNEGIRSVRPYIYSPDP